MVYTRLVELEDSVRLLMEQAADTHARLDAIEKRHAEHDAGLRAMESKLTVTITPDMVKSLREKTNFGLMDCKKALDKTNGDMAAAVEYLRTYGLAVVRRDESVAADPVYASQPLPCPFCGSDDVEVSSVRVECNTCGTEGTCHNNNKQQAIAAWNRAKR